MTASAVSGSSLRRSAASAFVVTGVLSFVCNVAALVLPLFNMQVFSRVLPTRDLGTLGAMAVGLGLGLITWALIEWLRSIALELVATRLAAQTALPLIDAASTSPAPDTAVRTALADLETLRTFLSSRACVAPFDICWAPILLLALLAMHWALGLLALACLALMLLLNLAGDALSRSAVLAANDLTAQSLEMVADALSSAESVVGLGMLPLLSRRWGAEQFQVGRLVHRALFRARVVTSITSALRAAMTGAMVALGLGLLLSGMAASGAMIGGNMILARLLLPFGSIAATRRQWIEARAAWSRLQRQLDETVPLRRTRGLPGTAPRLVVDQLTYRPPHSDRLVLRAISLAVEPGECVALVGPSSSGKSTLLRAITGVIPPTSGGVYLDGGSTFQWEREDFSRHVGYVPQQPALLDESVADNISRLGEPDLAAVVALAKRVGLHEVIAALPMGYATILGPHVLSSGQRQRLALARALYGGCKLLVLDEPSAFLDVECERELTRCLARLKREGLTILLSTHRPSLLSIADRAVVLQDGSVARSGPASDIREELSPRLRLLPGAAAMAS